jgi:ABC-2 type transport system ATP-binding protein
MIPDLTAAADRRADFAKPGRPLPPAAPVARAAAISVENLSKTYPVPLARLRRFFGRKTAAPAEALRGVTLDVREGEIFGLIGRNGAGKTTLTKIIATLVQPTSGAVSVRGFDSVRDEVTVRAQIGLASAEERSFYWRLSIEHNLLFFARLYGMGDRAARARIAELLARFELEPLARRRFGELSTGNKQRVMVARAMLNRPPVLLLDEPTRSLDPLAAASMRAAVRELAATDPPMTVLLTSHNLAEIEELCERVAVISRGRIRALDAPQALRALHHTTERVRLVAERLGAAEVESSGWFGALADPRVAERGARVEIGFTRETEDDALDRALRAVQAAGGRVVACDIERATLLDVLEGYEREEEKERAGGEGGEGVEGGRGV